MFEGLAGDADPAGHVAGGQTVGLSPTGQGQGAGAGLAFQAAQGLLALGSQGVRLSGGLV